MSKVGLGIDPGVRGGICLLVDGRPEIMVKMPIYTNIVKRKRKGKMVDCNDNFIDTAGLHSILKPIFEHHNPNVYLEHIKMLKDMGEHTNFKLGEVIGGIKGALQAYCDFYLMSPTKWQNGIWIESDIVYEKKKGEIVLTGRGKPKVDTKKTSLNCAKRLYPDYDFKALGGVTQIDGMIDALLIATHGESL